MGGKNKTGECPMFHPKICKKFIKYLKNDTLGCKVEGCNKWHPKICKNDSTSAGCSQRGCQFRHDSKNLVKDMAGALAKSQANTYTDIYGRKVKVSQQPTVQTPVQAQSGVSFPYPPPQYHQVQPQVSSVPGTVYSVQPQSINVQPQTHFQPISQGGIMGFHTQSPHQAKQDGL